MGATAISYLKTRFFSLITLLSFYLPGLAPSFGEASGYGLVVERLVANQSAGVRFSLPAPECSTAVVYMLREHKTRVRFSVPRKKWPGCSITVVFAHGVGKARVQFPAARRNEK